MLALRESTILLVTGGSDFHGDVKPQISLGTGHQRKSEHSDDAC